jgi:hypothetical protein
MCRLSMFLLLIQLPGTRCAPVCALRSCRNMCL